MGRLSRLDSRLRSPYQGSVPVSPCRLKSPVSLKPSYRMTRKTPLCRNCGMPMKGHSRSGCLIPNNTEQKDDGASMISSTPSFVIPETGPFRRQNPNYVPPPPSRMESLVLSSASLTPTEPVCSVNTMQRNFFPPLQQFTPNWSRPSSPQPHPRVPKQQSPFVLESASPVAALLPASGFGVQPGDSVRLVAGIYQIPSTTIESFRTRALSNGIYCVPLKLLKEERTQNVDLARSTWVITGPNPSDVDALVAILQLRGLVRVSQIWLTTIVQMVKIMDALHYRALALLLLCIFMFIAILG
jgi:hypothetical protein